MENSNLIFDVNLMKEPETIRCLLDQLREYHLTFKIGTCEKFHWRTINEILPNEFCVQRPRWNEKVSSELSLYKTKSELVKFHNKF